MDLLKVKLVKMCMYGFTMAIGKICIHFSLLTLWHISTVRHITCFSLFTTDVRAQFSHLDFCTVFVHRGFLTLPTQNPLLTT